MNPHPSWNTILSHLESPPNPELSAHLDTGCTACAERVDLAHAALTALSAGPLPLPPIAAVERAVGIVDADRSGLAQRVQEFLGRLSRAGQAGALPALRGVTQTTSQQLFEAGPFDVDVARLEDGAVVGQVLAREEPAPDLKDGVCLLIGEAGVQESNLMAFGEFRFASVRPGQYGLVFEAEGVRLVLPEVDLS
jgi:hypothetical protein